MIPGPLELSDNFPFECKLCGECCSGTMKVFLNPMDVLILASHMKFKHTTELWENNYLITEEGQNKALLPRMKFAGLSPGFCPFIINNWNEETSCLKGICSLHRKAKPLICRLAPVAREVDLDDETEEYFIQIPVTGCPGDGSNINNRVEEYLAPFRKELDWEKRWFELLKRGLDSDIPRDELLKLFFHFPLPVEMDTLLQSWESNPLFA